MEQIIENTLMTAAAQIEKQLDTQIERLENMDEDELRNIRQQRLKEMKELAKKKQEWLSNVNFIRKISNKQIYFEISFYFLSFFRGMVFIQN